MLELIDAWKGVRKRRKVRWVIEGTSVSLPPRRRIALLGAERTDNQMVLRILSGVEAPDKGVLRSSGLSCWPLGSQSFVDPGGTLRQNAGFLGRLYGFDAGEIHDFARTLSGVKTKSGSPLRNVAGSERRHVALALTLSIQFDWYFVDENLPSFPAATADLCESVCADRFSRAGVVWATSNPSAIEGYCNAGMILDRGRLTFYNEASEAFEAYRNLIEVRDAKRK